MLSWNYSLGLMYPLSDALVPPELIKRKLTRKVSQFLRFRSFLLILIRKYNWTCKRPAVGRLRKRDLFKLNLPKLHPQITRQGFWIIERIITDHHKLSWKWWFDETIITAILQNLESKLSPILLLNFQIDLDLLDKPTTL